MLPSRLIAASVLENAVADNAAYGNLRQRRRGSWRAPVMMTSWQLDAVRESLKPLVAQEEF
jgi:hypothetical protein